MCKGCTQKVGAPKLYGSLSRHIVTGTGQEARGSVFRVGSARTHLKPLPMGVVMGPLRPMRLRRTESSDSLVTNELVRGSTTEPMWCSSHSMGMAAASNTWKRMRWNGMLGKKGGH